MAITTLSGVISGLQPEMQIQKSFGATAGSTMALKTTWYVAGSPSPATAPSPGLAGAALTAPVTGQIPFNNPTSGNAYLSRANISTSLKNPVLLIDRLWHNSGFTITSTSAQTVNSVAWPARDINGSTDGEGVYIACEVSAAVGAATPTLTLSYTNSAGTSGRSATSIAATVASSSGSSFYVFALQAGDTGVRSVQSLTLSVSWVSGTIHLVAFRPIAMIQCDAYNATPNIADAFNLALPRVYNDSVIQMVFPWTAATAGQHSGSVGFTHG